jgi:hypothetical protein
MQRSTHKVDKPGHNLDVIIESGHIHEVRTYTN